MQFESPGIPVCSPRVEYPGTPVANASRPSSLYLTRRVSPIPRAPQRSTVSQVGATFSFVSNIISGGVLGFPFCFSRCGLVLGTLLLVCTALSQAFTLKQLVYASTVTRTNSFEEARARRPVSRRFPSRPAAAARPETAVRLRCPLVYAARGLTLPHRCLPPA